MVMETIDQIINKMSGSYSPQQIFSDWIESVALAIVNSSTIFRDKVWQERERRYCDILKRYEKESQRFTDMLAILTLMLEEEIKDHLGEVYMKLGGSKQTGQFFTPWHLSKLTAAVANTPDGEVVINEPSCGSGGMIIAMAEKLHSEGKNYQQLMKVTAEDLDLRCCHMCYVQLSLLGINATVIHHDTLQAKMPGRINIFQTPKRKGVLM